MQPFSLQLFDLILIQLSSIRWFWKRSITVSVIVPLFIIIVSSSLADNSNFNTLNTIFIGNLVLSMLFETVNKVSSRFAYMRLVGMLEYFATLPIHKVALILATVFSFSLLSLPSLFVTILAGALILKIPIVLNPLLFLVVPLTSAALSALGAFIGIITRKPEEAANASTLLTFTMLIVGPVLIPANRLPDWLVSISVFSPTTHAASLLRYSLVGEPGFISVPISLLFLGSFTILSFVFVAFYVDWRQTT